MPDWNEWERKVSLPCKMMIIEGIDGNNSKLTYVTRYLFKPYFCDL